MIHVVVWVVIGRSIKYNTGQKIHGNTFHVVGKLGLTLQVNGVVLETATFNDSTSVVNILCIEF